jgi:hypothetical protein
MQSPPHLPYFFPTRYPQNTTHHFTTSRNSLDFIPLLFYGSMLLGGSGSTFLTMICNRVITLTVLAYMSRKMSVQFEQSIAASIHAVAP